MSLDLTPFARRVHAAVTTNQCLDYAADVQSLIQEVQRLQSGYDNMKELHAEAYLKASIGRGISYDQMKAAGLLEKGIRAAVEAFDQGAR